MAFRSNILLRQKMPQPHSTKRQTPINKIINFPKEELMLSLHGVDAESKNDNEMIDLIQSNDIEDPDSEVQYVTVILNNDGSIESDVENVELVEESSEAEGIRDEEYILTEESLDEIPKMSLKKHRSRRRTKDAENRSLTCSECGKTLSNFSSYKYHMQLHSEVTTKCTRTV